MIIAAQILGGLALLLLGGRFLVRAGVAIADRFGVSPLLIGLTIVSIGTSSPELLVAMQAAIEGVPGLAIGNVVGSNVGNVLLVLGLAGAIHPIARNSAVLRRDGPVMLIAVLAFAAIAVDGSVSRWQGVLMVLCLLAYLFAVYVLERRSRAAQAERGAQAAELAGTHRPLWLDAATIVASLGALLVGSDLMVDGAVALARRLAVHEAVIGATIVAFGTIMPEAVASIAAALHRNADLAVGNVVGSIVFNILGIVGAVAIVRPLPVPPEILRFDLWVMIAAAVLLVALTARSRGIGRATAIAMLAAYGVYAAAALLGLPARLFGT